MREWEQLPTKQANSFSHDFQQPAPLNDDVLISRKLGHIVGDLRKWTFGPFLGSFIISIFTHNAQSPLLTKLRWIKQCNTLLELVLHKIRWQCWISQSAKHHSVFRCSILNILSWRNENFPFCHLVFLFLRKGLWDFDERSGSWDGDDGINCSLFAIMTEKRETKNKKKKKTKILNCESFR